MERGAAFGLQRLQQPTHGNDMNTERVWDNAAYFLLDKVRTSPRVVFN